MSQFWHWKGVKIVEFDFDLRESRRLWQMAARGVRNWVEQEGSESVEVTNPRSSSPCLCAGTHRYQFRPFAAEVFVGSAFNEIELAISKLSDFGSRSSELCPANKAGLICPSSIR